MTRMIPTVRRMKSLAEFLKDRVGFFRANKVQSGVFVCGNEAGDLDSTISALSYAYIVGSHEGRPLIPFINTPTSKIIDMRGEIQLVLKENGLQTQDLLFMDEVLMKSAESKCQIDLVLIDHNELSGRWHRKYPTLKSKVLSIIDHHQDAGLFNAATPRIVQVCGSSASLLVELFRESSDEAQERLQTIARPLLQTIIFDTVNLTWRQKEIDIEAVNYLSSLPIHSTSISGDTVMDELEQSIAAEPESNFDIYDLLYKDYKLYLHHQVEPSREIYYGISTLHIPFSLMVGPNFEKLSSWLDGIRRFMNDEEVIVIMMTNAIREKGCPKHYQQFSIFAAPGYEHLVPLLYATFQEHGTGFKEIISGDGYALYDQENISISRKQFHPMTKEFMKKQFP